VEPAAVEGDADLELIQVADHLAERGVGAPFEQLDPLRPLAVDVRDKSGG